MMGARAPSALGLISVGFALLSSPVDAQADNRFTIASITTTQSCQYFLNSEYDRTTVATPWLFASQVSWRSWWVKDCEQNFATMRSSLAAALASTGKFSVGPGGYILDVNIGDVSGGGAAPDNPAVGPRGYAFSKTGMLSTFSVTVKDRGGRIIYGGLSSKMIETGVKVNADGTYASSSMTGDAVYGVMQNELALAIARIVAFKIEPVRVIEVDDDRIKLNYGAPFLKMGTNVDVSPMGSLRPLRYVVVSADNGSAIAEVDGDNEAGTIKIGDIANAIENDDPAANARRYKRNKLP